MKRTLAKQLCLGMSLVLIMFCAGCIPRSAIKSDIKQQGYYLKQGDPAPIEGWLIDKETLYDIVQDALKGKNK